MNKTTCQLVVNNPVEIKELELHPESQICKRRVFSIRHSAIDCESSMEKLMDIREKKSMPSGKENMGNQMQMIRVGEGALGVGQTERAITPSSKRD